MLNLRKLVKNYDDSARSFAELVPWMGLIAPHVILNKDGSLLVVCEFNGLDSEGLEQFAVDQASAVVERGMRLLDERFTVWWTMDRRRTNLYPAGNFGNPVSAMVDSVWREHYIGCGQYTNRTYLSLLYTPPGGIEGLFEKVAHYVKAEGMPLGRAIGETLRSVLFDRAAFKYEARQLETYLAEFSEKVEAFLTLLGSLNIRRLVDEELLGFLHRRASPTSEAQRINIPRVPLYLDSLLPGDTLISRGDTLLFRGTEDRHVGAVSVKDWPSFTAPGLIDGLMALPGEITVTQIMRLSSKSGARSFVQDVERHNRNVAKSLLTYVGEAMTKEESRKVDLGRIAMAEDASTALTEMTTEGRAYGHYNLTVLAYGKTEAEADQLATQVKGLLNDRQFVAVRENMHLLSCFAGSLPGQAGALVRWHFVSTGNLSDLAPVRGLSVGQAINEHFTNQFGSPEAPVPSLTALPTEFSTPYYFNFHSRDLAHTLVVGPSRAGKSAFMNYLIAQHQKYNPCHTFIFDKDYSCRIPTILQGGTHIDMTGERSPIVPLNPMLLLNDKEHWSWLAGWLEILIGARGYKLSAADSREIWTALGRMAEMPMETWRLATLGGMIPSHLHEQLEAWIGEGRRAKYFDNETDAFALGSFTCIEMKTLFQDPVLAAAFLEYAFYRISMTLDGRPALIYVEEAWFMLADERFAAKINDWLRTLAKRNAWLVLTTQSLDELANSSVFATIIDNIQTRIYLANPNARAHQSLYMEKFSLNAEQVKRIINATEKLNYYIVTPQLSRMVAVHLPPEVLAVVRSDEKAQNCFDRHATAGGPEWQINYLEEMAYGEVREKQAA